MCNCCELKTPWVGHLFIFCSLSPILLLVYYHFLFNSLFSILLHIFFPVYFSDPILTSPTFIRLSARLWGDWHEGLSDSTLPAYRLLQSHPTLSRYDWSRVLAAMRGVLSYVVCRISTGADVKYVWVVRRRLGDLLADYFCVQNVAQLDLLK